MIERAMIAGLNSTAVDVSDLRMLPSAVGRHLLKTHDYAAGFHVGSSVADPEVVAIRFFEEPGIQITAALQKEIEKHFTRGELRRAAGDRVGTVDYPVQARESYAEDLLGSLDQDAIREREYRIVVDYGYSSASFVLPLVLGPLGVEVVAAHAFAPAQAVGARTGLRSLIGQTKKLVSAVGADFGVVFDRPAERLYLIDEGGHEIPVEQALLLFLRLIGSNGRRGKLAFPVTVTSQVDEIVKGTDLEVIRTPASLGELTKAAAQDGVIFAGAIGGGYVFPDFLPAYDAMASLCKLLELLAPVRQPLSALVAELPASTLVHRQLPCPWSQKGTVMRVLTERLKGRDLDLLDGIKVNDRRGWAQVLPDPDEPLVHIYAEGRDERASNELESELRELVEDVLQHEAEISS
jgi:mannose-1-phosphate guanylyltransferase / phosphomannomutase